MSAAIPADLQHNLKQVSLDDKYTLTQGWAYMSGTQALVRLPMLQQARDQAAGLNTAGFISGYRGSPLGALDQALWQAKDHLNAHDIVFQPGLNEDIAATSLWGTQQVTLQENATHDGVFGMWYGKGPGVDRSMDVFKHANNAGTAAKGGVLVLAGDDHGAKSSTVAYQSEHNFIAAGMPVLYPANVQEYLDFGIHGWALSRFAGVWVGMKCVTEVVESSASINIDSERVTTRLPQGLALPADGLNIRWPDTPLAQEERLVEHKLYAALAYIRENNLNPTIIDPPNARFGIMTAGKAYLDTRQALLDLGLDDATCMAIGLRLIKIGCVWPLNAQDAREFASGLDEILVVEEKRQILEYALKEELYNWRDDVRPKIYGKFNEKDNAGGEWSVPRADWLLPAKGELSPATIALAIASRLEQLALPDDVRARIQERVITIQEKQAEQQQQTNTPNRIPWFCSGCPHNTSTRVPEGSRAMAGIGCHYMTIWMDRNTETFSQMGGEGAAWIGQQPFTKDKHIFANIGDGTYFHSGVLAIRAAIAAKANITYKILYNDAVAMTGGQPVDGQLTVPDIVAQMQAEGAAHIVVVTDEPERYKHIKLPHGVPVYHRRELDRVQRELRDMAGTTILIYDQTCATEKRRRRKRGTYPDPARRVFINDEVCEGCGDCSVKSNCLSVEPLETPLGTKRKINQSSCNKDFSCIDGFCPSFITAEGAQIKKPQPRMNTTTPQKVDLPRPDLPALDNAYGIIITGIGGTGVVTIGSLLGMAAHIEGKGVSVLDMAGLAQKGGAVLSHVQIAPHPGNLHATRIATGAANLIIGCDSLVTAGSDVLALTNKNKTAAAINSARTPTADFIGNARWKFPAHTVEHAILNATGEHCQFLDASRLAMEFLGDAIYANPLLLGFAWQKGWIPLQEASLKRAIELNGVKVKENHQAFDWGRQFAHEGIRIKAQPLVRTESLQPASVTPFPESLDALIKRHQDRLTAYQNPKWAQRYAQAINKLRTLETRLHQDENLPLTRAAAINLAKLMTYKDEYEVARLYTDPNFLNKLREEFEGEPGKDYQLHFHLAPPLLSKRNERGELVKRQFGPRTMTLFRIMTRFKWLRGTALDIFGYTEERRQERALIQDYFAMLDEFSHSLTASRLATAIKLAELPDEIRGFGHIKEASLQQAEKRRKALWEQYHTPEPTVRAAS